VLDQDRFHVKEAQLIAEGRYSGQVAASLREQLSLQKLLTEEKILQAAQSQIDKMNPVAAAVGSAGIDAGVGFNAVVLPMMNDMFGTNAKAFKAETIAAFAIGSADFFDSWEGNMKGTAVIIGSTIELAAKGADKYLGTNISEGAATFGAGIKAMAGTMGGWFGTIVSVVKKMFDPAFIQGIADSIGDLVEKLPELLMKAFTALADAMDKVIGKLPEIVSGLMNAISGILDRLISSAPAFIDAIVAAFENFLNALPAMAQKLADAIPGILDKLLGKLPGSITLIFDIFHSHHDHETYPGHYRGFHNRVFVGDGRHCRGLR